MNDIEAKKAFIDIASQYKFFYELKELCFTLNKSGEIALGGRKSLIEDISHDKYSADCIQVIFAASSDYYEGDMPEHKNQEMDILKNLMQEIESYCEVSDWIDTSVQPSLLALSPTLVRVVCSDHRHT